ncbi:MAG: beta-N-acetylhexosaminidase [Firmicutes bacterium]|jgi:beta-N-acetylhexosaminidase|nr:beta-N-acetylhexosaminidase [Bacillota bacterium]
MKKISIFMVFVIFICTGCLGKSQTQQTTLEYENQIDATTENETASNVDLEQQKEYFLNQKIASMTLEQKVGQLFFCSFRKDEQNLPVTVCNESIANTIKQYHIGGVVLFGENIDTEQQTKQLIADIKKHSDIPLFIGVDEEGGRVSRLHASGKMQVADVPTAKEIGDTNDTNVSYEYAKTIGSELKELGFDVDFAPVADVNTNAYNIVIGDRAFSSDANIAGDMVSAFVKGLQEQNISACAKHFPGHGDTIEDSHNGIALANRTLQQMQQTEWIPFQKAIEQNVDFIMAGHITTPNATTDGLPASLSHEMLTEQLRNNMHFDGIIITDALDMGAITKYYENAPFDAVCAGADMVLMPFELQKSYETICHAVKEGIITEQELNQKVKRILSLKYDKGYF